MEFNYQDILTRSKALGDRFEELENLSESEWSERSSPKSWTLLEVIQHLNVIYGIYLPKFEEVLSNAKDRKSTTKDKSSILGNLAIGMTAPKNGKRKWKMKTLKFLEPKVDPTEIKAILQTFKSNKDAFNSVIEKASKLDVGSVKMATSLGDLVKLYVPECIEFVLVHEERHFRQIEELAGLLVHRN